MNRCSCFPDKEVCGVSRLEDAYDSTQADHFRKHSDVDGGKGVPGIDVVVDAETILSSPGLQSLFPSPPGRRACFLLLRVFNTEVLALQQPVENILGGQLELTDGGKRHQHHSLAAAHDSMFLEQKPWTSGALSSSPAREAREFAGFPTSPARGAVDNTTELAKQVAFTQRADKDNQGAFRDYMINSVLRDEEERRKGETVSDRSFCFETAKCLFLTLTGNDPKRNLYDAASLKKPKTKEELATELGRSSGAKKVSEPNPNSIEYAVKILNDMPDRSVALFRYFAYGSTNRPSSWRLPDADSFGHSFVVVKVDREYTVLQSDRDVYGLPFWLAGNDDNLYVDGLSRARYKIWQSTMGGCKFFSSPEKFVHIFNKWALIAGSTVGPGGLQCSQGQTYWGVERFDAPEDFAEAILEFESSTGPLVASDATVDSGSFWNTPSTPEGASEAAAFTLSEEQIVELAKSMLVFQPSSLGNPSTFDFVFRQRT